VTLKTEGIDLLKFSNSELANSTILGQSAFVDARDLDSKAVDSKSLEYGLKLTNVIRTAFGVKTLPVSFLKLAELTARHSFDDLTAIAKATGHFSGNASWYGPHFHGRKTSDGHIFNQDGLTAAHRSLPFGTKLLVTNRKTGDSCVVKVNDRGPFIGGRIIDLSKGAARQLNMLGSGVAMVDCIVLGRE
jgi:rare lipoprotein A